VVDEAATKRKQEAEDAAAKEKGEEAKQVSVFSGRFVCLLACLRV
jgi:hypothetical protein